jgi:hypothetical protein
MRRGWALVAVAVVAVAFALLLNGLGDPTPASAAGGTTAQRGDDSEAERSGKPDRDELGDHGHGPPSWAHGARQDDHAWKKAWAALTPAEREKRMRALAEEHARGMRQWHRCVASGHGACQKPMPPGLAKKQQAG